MAEEEMKLKRKYKTPGKAKFGGKKSGGSNSLPVGKSARRKKRSIVVSQSNSPEQFGQWRRAIAARAK